MEERDVVSLDQNMAMGMTEPIVLLFKHDLRVDDHPGLHKAIQSGRSIVPLYCLDPELLHPYLYIPGGVEMLWGAVQSLRESLSAMNSYLIVRCGSFAETLANFVADIGATTILTEAEVDIMWREAMEQFKAAAPEIIVEEWTCEMYPFCSYGPNFRQIHKSRMLQDPLTSPSNLSSLRWDGLKDDQIPDVESLKQALTQTRQTHFHNGRYPNDPFERSPIDLWERWSICLTSGDASPIQWVRRYLEFSSRGMKSSGDDALEQLILATEDHSFPGISFSSLFAFPLSLGILSPRQVAHEVEMRVRRNALCTAALLTSESCDFHNYLAREVLQNGCSSTPGSSVKQFWRWQGFLAEFTIAKPKHRPSRGNIVLVHGFGASCMHWRRNVDALTNGGYTVYCPTLPGYGRTQKLYMKYTQSLWTEFLAAFITEVVREPAVLAGNSIGAFVAVQTAASHPDVIPGLVLINPAGPVVEDYDPADPHRHEAVLPWRFPSFVVDALSQLLLFYLEKSASRILKSVYPVQRSNADEAFLNEILRASHDPNAIAVVKSVFFLTKPDPLNYLLSELYRRPVLLLQGALDPLSNAVQRAHRIEALCPNVHVQIMEAGHCGHDETPDVVNAHFLLFVDQIYHPV